ncbi:MAG: phage portal protein, partial [Candidatus Dormibacteraeota bacterium]|nr:phage portal protein [Candidatus Dormibacteraeota bacterium]
MPDWQVLRGWPSYGGYYPYGSDPALESRFPPGPGFYRMPVPWSPSRSEDLMRQHLDISLMAIGAKRYRLDRRWAYYLGQHNEVVLSRRFHEMFSASSELVATLFTNYCSLCVDAPLTRLRLTGWRGDQALVREVEEHWTANDLDLESEEIHRQSLTAGEAYVLVWPRFDDRTGMIQITESRNPLMDIALQDARNVHVQYGSRRRGDRLWATKVWFDRSPGLGGQPCWRAIMYYPEEVVRFVAMPTGMAAPPPTAGEYDLDPEDPGAPHNMGAVPMVRFSRWYDSHSRLDDVIPIQDRINKLTADKIVAAEYGAFPQRWVLTNDEPPPDVLLAGPGSVWAIPPTSPGASTQDAPTSVGQFPFTPLSNYDQTIREEINAFFTIAELPRHLLINPGVTPSAEAIKADEGPMVAWVRGYRDAFSGCWADVMNLCTGG